MIVNDDPDAIELWNTRATPWISVEDQLPGKYSPVLIVYRDEFGDASTATGVVNDRQEWIGIGTLIKPDSVTYWMDFPDLPRE